MVEIQGLIGYRPISEKIAEVTTPPYDIIEGPLKELCKARYYSLYHVILGQHPVSAWSRLMAVMQEDNIPSFYRCREERPDGSTRTGFFAAAKIGPDIFDHEETKKPKVQERLKLSQTTGYSFGPVLTLTESDISNVLNKAEKEENQLYEFVSDFSSFSDLDGILNRVFRIKADSPEGVELINAIRKNPLFIADGHHRYGAAVLNSQQYFLTYISEAKTARIQAYNKVINSTVKFDDIKHKLKNLQEISEFKTPAKEHQICIYSNGRTYLWDVRSEAQNSADLVGSLDASILEKELYHILEIPPNSIRKNSDYIDYYPEYKLDEMVELANLGKYDIIVALHPVSVKTVMEISRNGKKMPSKSTYFDKIPSGIVISLNY
jgi:uncharacterized protein (DUF1015 family)